MIGPVEFRDVEISSAKLREAAQSFEALFTRMLLQSLRSTVKQNDLFHGGRGESMLTGMLDESFAQAASLRGRGFGIAELIQQRFARSAYSE